MSAMLALRKSINASLSDKERISITTLLVKAVAKGLTLRNNINATLDGEEIKLLKDVNLGVAVALDDGLIVPVVRNADTKSIYDINAEIRIWPNGVRKTNWILTN
jgi:pyruvate dehydrogenase E2 component (dihydrolipoamide acetyltransferase)